MIKKLKQDKIRVYFSVDTNEILPDKLTELIGLQPSKILIKGQPILKDKPDGYRFKYNVWEIKSKLDESVGIEEHILNVLDQLRPYKEKIIQATKEMYKELAFTLFYSDSRPGIHFRREILKELAEYEVELDFDIYFREEK